METIYNVKNLFSDSCDRGKSTVASLSALIAQVKPAYFVDLSVFSDTAKSVVLNEDHHPDRNIAEIVFKLFNLDSAVGLMWDVPHAIAQQGSFSLGTMSMVKGQDSYSCYCPNLLMSFRPYQAGGDVLEYDIIDVSSVSPELNRTVIHGFMRLLGGLPYAGKTEFSPFVDPDGNTFSWLDILSGLNQNLSMCTVFETAAELLSTGSLTIANFTSAVQAKLSGLKDQALTVYRQIVSAIPMGVRSVLEVIRDWMKVITESTSSSQTWDFSKTRYSTNGFCWGAFFSVAATVVQVIGLIVMAFSRVAGIIVTVLGSVAKVISDFFNNKINESVHALIDANSCNNNFATAVIQQTFTDTDVDQWRLDFFNCFMPSLKAKGFYKVVAAGLEGWIWYVDDHTFKMEMYPSARFKIDSSYSTFYDYGSQSAAIYARHKSWRTDATYGISTEVLMQNSSTPIDVDTFSQQDKDYSTRILLSRGYASAFWVATCLDLNTYYYVDPQGIPGSDEDRACYSLLKYVSEQMANAYAEQVPNGKWEELTNYNTSTGGIAGAIIAIFENNYGHALQNLCGHIATMFQTDFPDSSIPGSEHCVYPIFTVPARGLDAFYPPEYTSWAITSSIIATAAIVVITTAVAVAGVIAWKRFSTMKAARISSETEAAWEQYKKTGSKDDLKAYRTCCLKQNTIGRVVGCSAVSNSNFWAASSCDASGSASNISDSLASLATPVTEDDEYMPVDPTLYDILKIIKGSI